MPPLSSTTPRAALIVNPRAGALARDPALLEWLSGRADPTCEVFVTTDSGDLERAIQRILESRPRLLVICGGDGTYHAVVTALFRAAPLGPYPPLGLVRAGTVCTVARDWGSPRATPRAVGALLAPGAPLTLTPRPTLRVDDGGAPRVGFIFGTGLVSRFFEEYERRGAGGNRTALAIAGQLFVESLSGGPLSRRVLSPLPCRVRVDGQTLPATAWSLIVAAVVQDLGLHLQLTHRAGEDPLRPHLIASSLPPHLLGPQWPLVLLGRKLLGTGGFDGLASRFTVSFDEPGSYILDGDAIRADEVTISAGPGITVATARDARAIESQGISS